MWTVWRRKEEMLTLNWHLPRKVSVWVSMLQTGRCHTIFITPHTWIIIQSQKVSGAECLWNGWCGSGWPSLHFFHPISSAQSGAGHLLSSLSLHRGSEKLVTFCLPGLERNPHFYRHLPVFSVCSPPAPDYYPLPSSLTRGTVVLKTDDKELNETCIPSLITFFILCRGNKWSMGNQTNRSEKRQAEGDV